MFVIPEGSLVPIKWSLPISPPPSLWTICFLSLWTFRISGILQYGLLCLVAFTQPLSCFWLGYAVLDLKDSAFSSLSSWNGQCCWWAGEEKDCMCVGGGPAYTPQMRSVMAGLGLLSLYPSVFQIPTVKVNLHSWAPHVPGTVWSSGRAAGRRAGLGAEVWAQ